MAKYSKKLVERIGTLIRADSYTIAEICRIVGIAESTFYEWQNTKPEFSECIKKAQSARTEFFVAEAKKSLLKKIQGYTVQEKKIVTVDSGAKDANGKPIPKIKEQSITDKHIQPDTTAIIFTLVNGDPENFKNRQHTEVTGKEGRDLFGNLTDEELDTKIDELEKKLNK